MTELRQVLWSATIKAFVHQSRQLVKSPVAESVTSADT